MPYIWRCQISYNGSGTFLINSAGQPVVPGTTITTTAFNALTADLASGLTTAMTKDGQTVPTANIPMGGFKLTGLGAGTSATDAAQFGQLQNAPVATLITVAGADTITGTLVQTLTAYATGQQFSFVAAGTNTTAVTLNIDGLGAKAVTRTGAVALAAGALVSGQMAIVEYDGTRFQLINANAFTNLTVSGALTVGTTLAVTGVATLTAQPILSSLTASLPVFSDASKGLVSNAMTGTGSVVMSASPTLTGTIGAASQTLSGSLTVGTTLGVTGTATMAAISASGTLTLSATSASVLGGGTTGSASFLNSTGVAGLSVFGATHATLANQTIFYGDTQKFKNTGGTEQLSITTGAVTMPGTLGVTGTTTLSGATNGIGRAPVATVTAAIASADQTSGTFGLIVYDSVGNAGLTVRGDRLVNIPQNATVGGTLGVTGAASITRLGTVGGALNAYSDTSFGGSWQVGDYSGLSSSNTTGIFSAGTNFAMGSSASDTYKFLSAGYASRLKMGFGTAALQYSSASGAAGGAVTWVDGLTVSNAGAVSIPGTLGVTGTSAGLHFIGNGSVNTGFASNLTTSNNWGSATYVNNGFGTLMFSQNGTTYFYRAASGSAGGAATLVEIMNLSSSGLSVTGTLGVTGLLTLGGGTLLATSTALTNGAAASVGTLTNAPAVGNPTKWIPINDNGTTRYIPAW